MTPPYREIHISGNVIYSNKDISFDMILLANEEKNIYKLLINHATKGLVKVIAREV